MASINFAEPIQRTQPLPEVEVKELEPEQKKRSPVLSIVWFILIIVLSVGTIIVIRTCILSPYVIPSGSMESTIMPDDHILAEQLFKYTNAPIEQSDIVTFIDPKDNKTTLIKRVIALGGQTIEFKDGYVYIDGVQQNEDYTKGLKTEPAEYTESNVTLNYPYTIPEGYIWVMGDNRTNSADSRVFGPVPLSSITGRAVCIYWPFEHIQILN